MFTQASSKQSGARLLTALAAILACVALDCGVSCIRTKHRIDCLQNSPMTLMVDFAKRGTYSAT